MFRPKLSMQIVSHYRALQTADLVMRCSIHLLRRSIESKLYEAYNAIHKISLDDEE